MEHFKYHAGAVGLSARINQPFSEVLPVQASVALPEAGGFGTARVDHVRFRNILTVRSVTSVVAGSYSERDRTYDALATTITEDFDVLGIVKADYIVARIASIHPAEGGPPRITPLGSHFENLRIAGYPVKIDLATDTFSRLDTLEKVKQAYRTDESFRQEFDEMSGRGKGDRIPERVQHLFPWRHSEASESIPEKHGAVHCSLVRDVAGLPGSLVKEGHTVVIPGFGVVRLAEFRITEGLRSLTMLEINLGSTPDGNVSSGPVYGNGSPW